jgi:hypothetical protein
VVGRARARVDRRVSGARTLITVPPPANAPGGGGEPASPLPTPGGGAAGPAPAAAEQLEREVRLPARGARKHQERAPHLRAPGPITIS